MISGETSSRAVTLQSGLNMRDLGGLTRVDGAKLRRCLVFRAGSIGHLTDPDIEILRHKLKVQTYIDLRTKEEVSRDGGSHGALIGVRWLHAPIAEIDSVIRSSKLPRPSDYLQSYIRMLDVAGPALSLVLETVRCQLSLPAIVGCTAGKDRTGVIVGILLWALGVRRSEIANDYALSGRFLRRRLDWFCSHWVRKGLTRSEYSCRLETVPATMLGFLAYCTKRFASPQGLLDNYRIPARLVDECSRTLFGGVLHS